MPELQHDLRDLIAMQIRANGPISIAEYMALCLTHPRHGYYKGADPLGAGGDFITAPEISQMFGELIGFFCVNLWQQMDEPKSFTLLELGPGRGTLMQDALRAAAKADGFIDAMHLQLFETNPALREQQTARLGGFAPYWQPAIDAVGDDPVIVIANEFFDALPVRQYVRAEDGWHERLVGLRDAKLSFGLSPTPITPDAMPASVRDSAIGSVYEVSLASAEALQAVSRRIAANGGALLAIDYGHGTTRTGETLQAVSRHKYADPLDHPGEVDLSTHVDFGLLADVARAAKLTTAPLATQGDFLRRLGIAERAEQLTRANPREAANIATALRRLTDAAEMGDLFKTFCAHSPGLEPIGFA